MAALSIILPLERIPSPALLYPQSVLPPAHVGKSEDVVKVLVYFTSTICSLVCKIFDFQKTEYRADALSADHPAQASRLTGLEHLEKPRSMAR